MQPCRTLDVVRNDEDWFFLSLSYLGTSVLTEKNDKVQQNIRNSSTKRLPKYSSAANESKAALMWIKLILKQAVLLERIKKYGFVAERRGQFITLTHGYRYKA